MERPIDLSQGQSASPAMIRDKKLLISILTIGVVAVAVSWIAFGVGESWFLKRNALASAVKWATFVQHNLSDRDGLLGGNQISPADRRLFEFASKVGDVFRYKIFGADGRILFSSRQTDIGKVNVKPYFTGQVMKGRTFVKIAVPEDTLTNQKIVGEAYVPVMENGRFRGAIEVYIDMTEQAIAFHHGGNLAFIGLLALLGAIGTVCGVFVYRNIRARNRELREVLDSRGRLIELTMALQESEERFKAVIDHSPTKIHIKDLEGRYSLVNRQVERLFGMTEEEVIGKSSQDIFPQKMGDAFENHDQTVLKTGQAIEREEEWFESGHTHTYLTVKFPIRGADGKITAIGAIGTDITERKRTEETLRAAKREAECASLAKSQFLANMSHELRTPLNAIIGFSEIIRDGAFGPLGSAKYKEFAADINLSGQHLLELINDILDLSRIEAGKLELNEETIDIQRVVGTCLLFVKERANKPGVTLECAVADNLPALYADERKLKQMLLNLLTNAVKFTPAGGRVTLTVRAAPDEGYTFEIADTGIGIAPEDIPKVMEPFGQADSGLDRKYEGTGLGLPLTCALVELHGGTLDLQSAVGAGTTATLRFPAKRIVMQAATGT